jgi:CheY-like chemotaxis protein/tetratricopeptide (TPR) repeat protein
LARLILHVDDDPDLPEGVVAVLEADGYQWAHTTDPEEVMRLVEREDVALVLMEVDLAGCDGLDLLAGILAAGGDEVPVLVLTRQPRDSGVHGECIALGASDYLSKPVLRAQLLSNIRDVALPAAKPAPVPQTPAAPRGDLFGELADSPVPELLARLRRRGARGALKLCRRGVVIGIELRNGTPICVASNRWGEDSGSISEDDAEAEIFETFAWSDGSWEFFTGRTLPRDSSCELSRDPAGLLMCGVLVACPVEQVRERLRKRSTLYVSVAGGGEEPFGGVELSAKQLAVLEEMGGQGSLGDLLDSMEFEERMLYGLWVSGEIELHAVPTLDLADLQDEAPAAQAGRVPIREAVSRPPERVSRPAEPRPGRERAASPTPAAAAARAPRSEDRDEISQVLRGLAQDLARGDDFEVLGVDVDASDEELRDAYRRRLGEVPASALDSSDLELRIRAERVRDRIESAYAHLKDAESRRAYALLRKEESQDREAENAAERALEGERWFRKGKGHMERRRYQEAAEAFGMASHLEPQEGEYLSHLGYALFLSNPDNKVVQREAMEHVANGIKRSPTREISHVYLGRMMKARGDDVAALKLFRRALRIKPDSHPALQEIRLLEMRKRKGKGILSRILGS